MRDASRGDKECRGNKIDTIGRIFIASVDGIG